MEPPSGYNKTWTHVASKFLPGNGTLHSFPLWPVFVPNVKKILEKCTDRWEDTTNISHNLCDLDLWPVVLKWCRPISHLWLLHESNMKRITLKWKDPCDFETLAVLPLNGDLQIMRHNISSWAVLVPNMKGIHQIGMKTKTGCDKHFERPCVLSLWSIDLKTQALHGMNGWC